MADLNHIRGRPAEAIPVIDNRASAEAPVGTTLLAKHSDSLVQTEQVRLAAESFKEGHPNDSHSRITNAHGAPRLAKPKISDASITNANSITEVSLLLAETKLGVSETQIRATKNEIEKNAELISRQNKLQEKQQAEAITAQAEQSKAQQANWILSLFTKIFTFVAAAVVTVVSGGTLGPIAFGLAVATAVYTAVDLALTVADKISTSLGGPSLSLDALIGKTVQFFAELAGHAKKDAEAIGRWVALGVTLALGIAGAIGGAVAISAATAVLKLALNAANATLAAASGAAGIGSAIRTNQATNLQAVKLDIDRILERLQQFLAQNQDLLKQTVQSLSNDFESVAKMLAQANQSNQHIAKNIA